VLPPLVLGASTHQGLVSRTALEPGTSMLPALVSRTAPEPEASTHPSPALVLAATHPALVLAAPHPVLVLVGAEYGPDTNQ
jgi:hypothetical protein